MKCELEVASQDCITIYAAFLKERYQGLSVFPDTEWPPSIGDQYIRLALIEQTNRLPTKESIREMQEDLLRGNVDKVEGEKKAIDIPGIFAHPEQGKQLRVLVDGAPGVGKTTLCRKISKDWGCEGFLSEYKLVVLLHLRDPRIAKAERIEDFFYHDDPELQVEVVRQVRKTSGAGVLLIFDGFDELSEEGRMERSLFLDIIKGEALSQCSVLVTSRPYASENLQSLRSVIRHVEVLGFTHWEIFGMVYTIQDETNRNTVRNILMKREDIFSLCYIPLNCAILLYVCQQQDYEIPATLTELFEIFILHALKRHAKLQNAHRVERRIHNLASLPPPLKNEFDHLCKLAFNGLVEDRMVFHYDKIEAAVCTVDGEMESEMESKLLGLMTAFKSFSGVGDNTTYQFLHLTIQEFLAARWVATHMQPEEQATFFKGHLSDDRFRMMLLFLSGITKLDDSSFGIVFSAELNFLIPEDEHCIRETEKLLFRLVHFLYESQNTIHCHTLACAVHEQTIVLDMCSTVEKVPHRDQTPPAFGFMKSGSYTNVIDGKTLTFQFIILAYFITRSSCTWKRLDFRDIATTSELLSIFFSQVEKEHPDIRVQQLRFEGVDSFKIQHAPFGQLARVPAFKYLECLEIVYQCVYVNPEPDINYSSSDLESLHCLIKTLEELALINVPGIDDVVIEKCIAPGLAITTTLKVLDITSIGVSNSGFCSLFRALQHNKSVETLHVEMRMYGDLRELGLAVESALRVNRTLQVFSYKARQYTYELSRGPDQVLYREELYCRLFGAVASTSNNSTLKVLTIADPELVMSGEVAESLVRMLHSNKSLTSLNLTGAFRSLTALACGLAQNTSLTKLCVSCPFSEHSLIELASALCQNASLKVLVLSLHLYPGFCAFRTSDFFCLLSILKLNRSLSSIYFLHTRHTGGVISEVQLKEIARTLVVNSHRAEIELEFGQSFLYGSQEYDSGFKRNIRSRYESVIQEAVDNFKSELVTMICSVYHVYRQYKREQFVAMVCFVYHVYEIYHKPL